MKSCIKFFSSIAIIIFVIMYLLDMDLFDCVSYSISIAASFYLLYDKFLWRYNRFDKTPKIYGKYSVENKSNFQGGIEFESEIEIKQTRSSLNIVETLRDGVCESVTASLHQSTSNGKWFLYYTYLTHPKNAEDDMHYGTSILCIHNRDRLEGSYFTNRTNQTKGSQIMIRKK